MLKTPQIPDRLLRLGALLLVCAWPFASALAQSVRLSSSQATAGSDLAYALAIEGSRVVTGSPGEDAQAGAVYLHQCQQAACSAPVRIAPVDLSSGDQFGLALALSGDTLAVASVGQNPAAVYVYTEAAGHWTLQSRLQAPEGLLSTGFGRALALQGNRLLVGADGASNDAGAVYVYTRSGSNWLQEQRLIASPAMPGERFGSSVSLSGDVALIGAPRRPTPGAGNHANGAAFVFTRSLGVWNQQAMLTAATPGNGDSFGSSLSLQGSRALIGAPLAGNGIGGVYVFESAAGIWSQQAMLAALAGVNGDRFGGSVALAGDTALVGAPFARGSCGAARMFRRINGSWLETAAPAVSTSGYGELLGWSVAGDGQRWAIGGPGADDHRGAAWWIDPVEQIFSSGFESVAEIACTDPAS
jgi:hypothetical protein